MIFQSLRICRAISAIAVTLFHLGGAFAAKKYFAATNVAWITSFGGKAGVACFFVLSGFLITYLHQKDFGQPTQFGHYIKKRLTRIYPMYWFVFGSVCLLGLLQPSLGLLPSSNLILLKDALLLPLRPSVQGTGASILAVAWTLKYEIFFYLFVGLLILNRRAGILVGCCALLLWAFSYMTHSLPYPFHMLGHISILGFVAGICLAYILKQRWSSTLPYRGLISVGWLLLSGSVALQLGGYNHHDFLFVGQGNRMRMPNKISTYKPRKLKTKGFSAKRGAAVDNGAHLKIALFFKGKRWSCNKIKTLHHAT